MSKNEQSLQDLGQLNECLWAHNLLHDMLHNRGVVDALSCLLCSLSGRCAVCAVYDIYVHVHAQIAM